MHIGSFAKAVSKELWLEPGVDAVLRPGGISLLAQP